VDVSRITASGSRGMKSNVQIPRLVKKFPAIIGAKALLSCSCSYTPATGPYPESV
jgi:hypothetical protein